MLYCLCVSLEFYTLCWTIITYRASHKFCFFKMFSLILTSIYKVVSWLNMFWPTTFLNFFFTIITIYFCLFIFFCFFNIFFCPISSFFRIFLNMTYNILNKADTVCIPQILPQALPFYILNIFLYLPLLSYYLT